MIKAVSSIRSEKTESMFVPPTGRFRVTVKYFGSSSDHPFTDSDYTSLLNLMYLWRQFVMK